MRKVVLYELLSLDGVAERPDEFLPRWRAAVASSSTAQHRIGWN